MIGERREERCEEGEVRGGRGERREVGGEGWEEKCEEVERQNLSAVYSYH